MKLFHYTVDFSEPLAVFSRLHDQPYSLFFDSADPAHDLSRYSFIAWHPFETIEAKNGKITVTNKAQQLTFSGDPFSALKERLDIYAYDMTAPQNLPPFQGGAAGFFGYDLMRGIEALPEDTPENFNMPDMAIGIYDKIYAYDHAKDKALLMIWAADEPEAQSKRDAFDLAMGKQPDIVALPEITARWHASHTRREYESLVRKVIDYIMAGDIFQANLSQRFDLELPAGFDAFAHYCLLRDINAAPFGTFMNFGNVKLSATSPERFLQVKDRQVETRPIKGTRPRGLNAADDAAQIKALESSEKDRAENTMIVDLLRNDISKVCEDHSIDVPLLCGIETFSGVHHLVSTITGTLRADKTPVDLLQACFPGGSITGAPKVRAMEIIEELEKTRRGPYCGAMGYIGFNGYMDTNIIIRTLVYEGNHVSVQAGGGITADSNPAHEYEETMAKAHKIFDSFSRAILTETRKAAS